MINAEAEVTLAVESQVTAAEFQQVLIRSGLAERRPANDLARLEKMLRAANLVVTARSGGVLVGIARSLCDGAFCCYLSDLAVSTDVQGRGVGRMLVERTRLEAGSHVSVILSSAPAAVGFYERIGMPRLEDAFCYRRQH